MYKQTWAVELQKGSNTFMDFIVQPNLYHFYITLVNTWKVKSFDKGQHKATSPQLEGQVPGTAVGTQAGADHGLVEGGHVFEVTMSERIQISFCFLSH